jgi:hypothetical protein
MVARHPRFPLKISECRDPNIAQYGKLGLGPIEKRACGSALRGGKRFDRVRLDELKLAGIR